MSYGVSAQGVSVQGVSVQGVSVLGVSVQGVHVLGGGGCPRTGTDIIKYHLNIQRMCISSHFIRIP